MSNISFSGSGRLSSYQMPDDCIIDLIHHDGAGNSTSSIYDGTQQSCPNMSLLPNNDENDDYAYTDNYSTLRQEYVAKNSIKGKSMEVIDLTEEDDNRSGFYADLSMTTKMAIHLLNKPSWNHTKDSIKHNEHCNLQRQDHVRRSNASFVNRVTNQADSLDDGDVRDAGYDIDSSSCVWRRNKRSHDYEADSTTQFRQLQHQRIGLKSISLTKQTESECNHKLTDISQWTNLDNRAFSTEYSTHNEIILLDSSDSENDEEVVDESDSNAFMHNTQPCTIQYGTRPSLASMQGSRRHPEPTSDDRASLNRHRKRNHHGKVDRFVQSKRRRRPNAYLLGDRKREIDKNDYNNLNNNFDGFDDNFQNVEFGRIAMQLLDLRRNLESFCRKLIVNCGISINKPKNHKPSSRPVTSLFHMIETLQQSGIIEAQLTSCMHTIRKLGNMAAHSDQLPDKLIIQQAVTNYKIVMNSFWMQNQN